MSAARMPPRPRWSSPLAVREREAIRRSFLVMALAHEIKQPLHSLNLNLELLQRRLGKRVGIAGEVAAPLQALSRVADRINGCLESVSARLLPEPVPPEPRDLGATLRDAVKRLAPAVRRAGLKIETEASPRIPPIPHHPVQLGIALDAVLDNALRASRPGGTITVRVVIASDQIRIDIVDRGEGMSPEVARRAAEVGFTTRGADGTGLTVAKFAAYHHLGGMHFESAPGRGTTVSITLPLQPEG